MAITADQTRWIAHLARLSLTDAELDSMTRQLGAILDYVDQLQQVNVDGVEPLAHPLPLQNVFRPDEDVPSLPVDEALSNAAQRVDAFYSVPAVFE